MYGLINALFFTNLIDSNGSNGDVLIGEWQVTYNAYVLLTCSRKPNNASAYLCLLFSNDQQIDQQINDKWDVFWQGGTYIFSSSRKSSTGTVTNGQSTYLLSLSDGSEFKKWGIEVLK